MAIRMTPDKFPEDHGNDPKRRAEARVFEALKNLKSDGHGIYEFRFREGAHSWTSPSG